MRRLTLEKAGNSAPVPIAAEILRNKYLKRLVTLSMLHIPDRGNAVVSVGGEDMVVKSLVGYDRAKERSASDAAIFSVGPKTVVTITSSVTKRDNEEEEEEEEEGNTRGGRSAADDEKEASANDAVCQRFPPEPPPSSPSRYTPPHVMVAYHIHCFFESLKDTLNPLTRCIILTGPPGGGKTYSIDLGVRLFQQQYLQYYLGKPSPPSVAVQPVRGSDVLLEQDAKLGDVKHLRNTLREMFSQKEGHDMTIVFVDEADALLSHSHVITDIMGEILDRLSHTDKPSLVIMATNFVEKIPRKLRRVGRIDEEIYVGPPGVEGRVAILESILERNGGFEGSANLLQLAQKCIGFVPADLNAMVSKARRMSDGVGDGKITDASLQKAFKLTPPSALREVTITNPKEITWDSIGGEAGGAKRELRVSFLLPSFLLSHSLVCSPFSICALN